MLGRVFLERPERAGARVQERQDIDAVSPRLAHADLVGSVDEDDRDPLAGGKPQVKRIFLLDHVVIWVPLAACLPVLR